MSDNRKLVLDLARMYKAGSDDSEKMEKVEPETFEEGGFTWYMVGRNSSHDFALAVDDNGKMWKRSYAVNQVFDKGYSYRDYTSLLFSKNPEHNKKARRIMRWVEDKHISEVTCSIGYIGHW